MSAADDPDRVLVSITPSPGRRWLGVCSLIVLGALLFYVALAGRPALFWQIVFLIGGGVAFWGADLMRRATGDSIELTREVLRTDKGVILARVDNVRSVERGAFAFKPSNGFLVRLETPDTFGWAPGLWWRKGTFLGVGGVVSAGQTRATAEILSALKQGVLPPADY